jgi:hypothetical protein
VTGLQAISCLFSRVNVEAIIGKSATRAEKGKTQKRKSFANTFPANDSNLRGNTRFRHHLIENGSRFEPEFHAAFLFLLIQAQSIDRREWTWT